MTTAFNELHPRVGDGTFANKQFSESAAVSLDALVHGPSPQAIRAGADSFLVSKLDAAATADVERLRRVASSFNSWERKTEAITTSPLSERIAQWDTLDKEARAAVLKYARCGHLTYLLEDDLGLGAGRIEVTDGALDDLDAQQMGQALHAIHCVEQSDVPGEITLDSFEGELANFRVAHAGVDMEIQAGKWTGVSASRDEEYSYYWMSRADVTSFGGGTDADSVTSNFKEAHQYAVVCQEMVRSPFRDHEGLFGVLDAPAGTADINYDGVEYMLNPAKRTIEVGGTQLHPSMAPGFLDHVAASTTGGTGEEFANDLDKVFKATNARLATLQES